MENVLISQERLDYLLSLEASLPKKIEEAISDYKKNSLKRLHEHDKQNPQAINARVKRYVEKHRESINARRREKRQAQKAQVVQEAPSPLTPAQATQSNPSITHITTIISKPFVERKKRAQKTITENEPVSYPPILKENVVVTFGS
jgi:hypothetical protein